MTRPIRFGLVLLAAIFWIDGSAAQVPTRTVAGRLFSGSAPTAARIDVLRKGTEDIVATEAVDPSGRYRVSVADGSYDFRVTSSADGATPQIVSDVIVDGADRQLDIGLFPAAGTISGIVRGLSGSPLPRVTVAVFSSSGQRLAQTATDAEGRYSVAAIGVVRLIFNGSPSPFSPGSWVARLLDLDASRSTVLDLDLPLVRLSGSIRSSTGSLVAGSAITASSVSRDTALPWEFESSGYATSDATGNYSFLVLEGFAAVSAFPAPGSAGIPAEELNVLLKGNPTHEVMLPVSRQLSGTVRGRGNNPLPNIAVQAYSTRTNQSLGQTRTDSNGRYSLPITASIYIRFSGSAQPNAPELWSVYRRDIDALALSVDLNLPVVQLRGVVKDSRGQPVRKASVNVKTTSKDTQTRTESESSSMVTTDDAGAYAMLLLSGTGPAGVYPESPTLASFAETNFVVLTDTTEDFVLPSPSTVSGTVRGEGNLPISNVYVAVNSILNDRTLAQTRTDSQGRYSVSASGRVNIAFTQSQPSLTASPGAPHSWGVTRRFVDPSATPTIDITLPVVKVTGKVTDSDGKPVGNVAVLGSSGTMGAAPEVFSATSYVISGNDGAYSMLLLRGTGEFSIEPLGQSGFARGLISDVPVNGTVTQRIVLQTTVNKK